MIGPRNDREMSWYFHSMRALINEANTDAGPAESHVCPRDWSNAIQLAEHLDATEKDVRYWARHGLIPSVKVSNQYFFNLQSVVRR